MDRHTLAQTYVQHEDKYFFISTMNRKSGARLAPGFIYAETIVWEFDPNTGKRGEMLHQSEDIRGSIANHMLIANQLFQTGSIKEDICQR